MGFGEGLVELIKDSWKSSVGALTKELRKTHPLVLVFGVVGITGAIYAATNLTQEDPRGSPEATLEDYGIPTGDDGQQILPVYTTNDFYPPFPTDIGAGRPTPRYSKIEPTPPEGATSQTRANKARE